MKALLTISSFFAATAASAHDSLAPHAHPHPISILPDVGTLGVAALVLALGVIAYTYVKRR
ncbi:MAG: hypothetical protein Q8M24_18130 [Pseudolabrys sp.]|nr:hypothetical protein [Pseudolabrys sp.]MDP2297365.1 hypothetical protein [Pseudolabrys sp.]